MVLLSIAVICAFIFYLILRCKDSNKDSESTRQSEKSEQTHQSFEYSQVYDLRKRIELLDDLRRQGILTEAEYEQKRADIIKELKI